MLRNVRNLRSVFARHLSHRNSLSYAAGDKLHGYTVTSVDDVPDFNLTSVELVHDKTGARHSHVVRDDSNNSFSVAFATTPMDDTGVAHILEHTALCGSQKYPIRDPFFKMLTRSFSTFMNAFTGPDFTMYPFSTQNKQDYYNLMSVYCDAVLFPNLNKLDFLQEGWRLEPSTLDDVTSDIVFKGVVFNEMKGYTNNSGYIFGQNVLNNLLPSHTYRSVSGGDPLAIPSLSHDQLVQFHKTHYHPSNAIFYTYGDLPLEEHLEKINDLLNKFEPITANTLVPSEPAWSSPRSITVRGPHDPSIADNSKNITVAVSYKLPAVNDRYSDTALSIVTDVLTSGAQSKFYEALILSELGSDFAPDTGLHTYTKDSYFTIGLKGVAERDVEKVLGAIERVWEEVVEGGVDEEQVAAVLHQMEISKKHQSTMFGLHLGVGMLGAWLHGAKPAEYLELNSHLQKFKKLEESGGHIKDIVSEHFLKNQHRLTVTMIPDEKFGEKLNEKEAELLRHRTSKLTNDDKAALQKVAQQLRSEQDTTQDLSCLPCIQLSDIPAEPLHYPVEHTTVEGVPVQIYTGPTNGLSYLRCLISDFDVADAQESALPVYSAILSAVGAAGKTYQQCDLDKMLRTGKFSCGTHTAAHVDAMDKYTIGTVLSSYCLNDNIPYMYSLWQDLISKPRFSETDRIKALLDSSVAAQKDHITQSGHHYALTRSRSHISPLGELGEQLGGFKQAKTMQGYQSGDIQELVNEVVGTHVVHTDRSLFSIALNTTVDAVDENLEALSQLLRGIPDSVSGKDYGIINRDIATVESINEFIEISNLGVNFCARSYRGVPSAHPDASKLSLLASLMSSKFLHKEVREKGGAYGSGAMIAQQAFSFMSYRDPNNTKTLEVFDRAIDWATEGSFTDQHLEEAKISIVGKLDAPVAPGSRGVGEFLGGMSLEQRVAFRTGIIEATREDIASVASAYLNSDQLHGNVVVGPETETSTFKDRGFLIDTFGNSES